MEEPVEHSYGFLGLGAGDDPLVSYAGSSTALGNARFLYADLRGSIVYRANSANGTAAINSYEEFGIPDNATTSSGRDLSL